MTLIILTFTDTNCEYQMTPALVIHTKAELVNRRTFIVLLFYEDKLKSDDSDFDSRDLLLTNKKSELEKSFFSQYIKATI